MDDVDLHRIMLSGKFHSYTMTVQVYNRDVVADAAITAVTHADKPFSAGFSQVVSDSGVENFDGAAMYDDSSYVSVYTTAVLFRRNVTSITLALYGDGATMARYVLTLGDQIDVGGGGDGGRESHNMSRTTSAAKGRLVGSVKATATLKARKSARFVVYDKADGEIAHIHEVLGDAKFVAQYGSEKAGAATALDYAKQRLPKLKAATVSLPDKFSFAPGQSYKIDLKKAKLVTAKRPA